MLLKMFLLFTGGVSSKVLQEVSIPIVPLKECNASYSRVARAQFPRGITNLFICAGLKEGGKDACQVRLTFHEDSKVRIFPITNRDF